MATITITIPDTLVALYNAARANWNVILAAQGGNLIPAPTKSALEKLLKDYIKVHVLSDAIRMGKEPEEVDALQAQLNAL